MADFSIPEQHHQALRKLVELPPPLFEKLLESLNSATPGFHKKSLSRRISAKIPELTKEDVSLIVETAMSMHGFRTSADMTISQFIKIALSDESLDELDLKDSATVVRTRVRQVLNSTSLWITAKAGAILTSHDRTFYSSRVFTDIRTIFRNSDASGNTPMPVAAVVVHMLRVRYFQNGERKDSFFALDSSDINEMIEVLERARDKSEKLGEMIETAGLDFLSVEED